MDDVLNRTIDYLKAMNREPSEEEKRKFNQDQSDLLNNPNREEEFQEMVDKVKSTNRPLDIQKATDEEVPEARPLVIEPVKDKKLDIQPVSDKEIQELKIVPKRDIQKLQTTEQPSTEKNIPIVQQEVNKKPITETSLKSDSKNYEDLLQKYNELLNNKQQVKSEPTREDRLNQIRERQDIDRHYKIYTQQTPEEELAYQDYLKTFSGRNDPSSPVSRAYQSALKNAGVKEDLSNLSVNDSKELLKEYNDLFQRKLIADEHKLRAEEARAERQIKKEERNKSETDSWIDRQRKEIRVSEPYKNYSDSLSKAEQIRSALNDPSAFKDLASLYAFMKSLDLRSVVRESEYSTASNTGSLRTRIDNMINKLSTGQVLTNEQRKDIANIADEIVKYNQHALEKFSSPTIVSAKKRNVDLTEIFGEQYNQKSQPLEKINKKESSSAPKNQFEVDKQLISPDNKNEYITTVRGRQAIFDYNTNQFKRWADSKK